jgi:acetylornithine/succinyldiaminopimelate/putrescine aminotransferase
MSGPLRNTRRERLAQALAAGKSIVEANEFAGYAKGKPCQATNGHRIAHSPEVRARIDEIQGNSMAITLKLQAIAAARSATTVASLIDEAEAARVLAMEIKNPAGAVAAIKEKGILSGMRIEKSEHLNRNVEQLTDDELAAYLTADGGTPDPETTTH